MAGEQMEGTNRSQDVDSALEAVTTERRRRVLRELRARSTDSVDLTTLADAITAPERPALASETVTIELHHRDLPKLAETGVLDYDSRSRTVRYHGHRGIELLLYVLEEEFD